MWRSQSSIGTTHRPPWTSLLANSKRVFRFAKYVANSAIWLACRGQLRVCVSDGLIKSKPEVRGTNRDSRALKDEPWLVKVRTLDDAAQSKSMPIEHKWGKLRENDRMKVRYRTGKYRGTVCAAEIE